MAWPRPSGQILRDHQCPLKGVVQGDAAMAGLDRPVALNAKIDGKKTNVSFRGSSGVHFSGLEFKPCQLYRHVVIPGEAQSSLSLIVVLQVSDIAFSFNKSSLTCHSQPRPHPNRHHFWEQLNHSSFPVPASCRVHVREHGAAL